MPWRSSPSPPDRARAPSSWPLKKSCASRTRIWPSSTRKSLVRDALPELVDLHHRGLQEEPAPSVDPAELINARAHALLATRQALSGRRRSRIAMAELPEAAAAYALAQRMPVSTPPAAGSAGPPAQRPCPRADAGGRSSMAEEHLDVDTARRAVLRRDPLLAAAYNSASPLPVPAPAARHPVDQVVADGLAEFRRMQAELAALERLFAPAAIATFAAEAVNDDQIDGTTIRDLPIFGVGEWNGRKYSVKDLDDMVAAFGTVGYQPPVKLGHDDAPDALAHGYVSSAAPGRRPAAGRSRRRAAETVELIKGGRLLSVSAEVFFDLKTGGKTFRAGAAGPGAARRAPARCRRSPAAARCSAGGRVMARARCPVARPP